MDHLVFGNNQLYNVVAAITTILALYDVLMHWKEIENNLLWLIIIGVIGGVGALFYLFFNAKKRRQKMDA